MIGLKPRQPFVEFALCAVGGIAASNLLQANTPVLWPFAATVAGLMFGMVWWLARQRGPRKNLQSDVTTRVALWIAVTMAFFAWHAFWQAEGPGPRLASQIPANGCVVRAIGVVDQEPSPEMRFRVRLESIAFDDNALRPSSAKILLQWPGAPPAYGDRVELIGSARNLRAPRNPGGFDSPAKRRLQGVYSEISVRYPRDAKILAHDQGQPILALAYRLRHRMERTTALDLDDSPQQVALIQSMVLGSPAGESMQELEDMFQYTGTIHLYAVTGMNVVMVAGMAGWLLQAFGVSRRGIALAVIPVIWIYCFVTGMGASSLRAAVMISVFLAGFVIDRPALPWNSLGIATVAVLAWDPNQLFKHGFVLSFALVAVLMWAARPVQAALERIGAPDPFLPRVLWPRHLVARCLGQKHIAGWLAASSTAWLGSIPLMVFYFHLWSPSTVPANMLGGLITWAIIALGLCSAVAGTFSTGLAVIFNNANWYLAKALLAVVSACANMPGGYFYVATPSFHRPPACEVEVMDMSGGGAVHIRTNPPTNGWIWNRWTHPAERQRVHDWLIDCGSTRAFPVTVAPYLRSRGVNWLDGFVITHGDSKHIGGAPNLLKSMNPTEVIDSPLKDRSSHRRALHSALAETPAGKSIVWRGDVVTLAPGIALHVLFPPDGLHARSADDKALVLRLDVDGPPGKATTRILFIADGGFITEHWLLEHAPAEELRSDILVKGMHSTDLSGTPEFLEIVRPSVVITSGADFPPAEKVAEPWASMVNAHGIRLLRQDKTGAVRIAMERDGKWMAEPYLAQE